MVWSVVERILSSLLRSNAHTEHVMVQYGRCTAMMLFAVHLITRLKDEHEYYQVLRLCLYIEMSLQLKPFVT